MSMLRYRLTPRGFLAFVRTARMQRRHLHRSWRDAVHVAWTYGPIR